MSRGGSRGDAETDQLPRDRVETAFSDFKPALNTIEAETEASRCINCFNAPCVHACPTAIDIPRFISRISGGNALGAARTILDANILGLSCAQACPTEVLCEGACVYNSLNKKPIMIGKLQRFAVESAYAKDAKLFSPGKPTGKRVALVGAGPASLACAHELRKHGHEAVIYEKGKLPGGLNTTGIAPYKMKADVSLREVEEIARMGVRFEFGNELGKNVSLDSLVRDHDAVFLGLGLGPDSKLDCPGAELATGAVDYIARIKTERFKIAFKTVLVVGGGNTALDACRELRGLGVDKVIVSYRRGESDMSGYAHELKAARQEGVEFWFNTLPTRFERMEGGVRATIAKTRIDDGGRVSTTHETLILECGLVLMATGQSKLEKLFAGVKGLRFDRGRIDVDAKTGRTGHPKIYAGGDLANGGMEVVNAVAEGRRAALAIVAALGGSNG
jgi:glutamate synthase (NADPH/NADH) small chain